MNLMILSSRFSSNISTQFITLPKLEFLTNYLHLNNNTRSYSKYNSKFKRNRRNRENHIPHRNNENDKDEVIESNKIKIDWKLNVNSDKNQIKILFGEWGDKLIAIDKPIGLPTISNLNDSVEKLVLQKLSDVWDEMNTAVHNKPELLVQDKKLKRKFRNLSVLFNRPMVRAISDGVDDGNGEGEDEGYQLKEMEIKGNSQPMLHFPSRLDKWTSGVMLIALTSAVKGILSQDMKKWIKKYRVITDIPHCTATLDDNSVLLPKSCCLLSPNLLSTIEGPTGTIKSFIGPRDNLVPYFKVNSDPPTNDESRKYIETFNEKLICDKCKDIEFKVEHPFISKELVCGSSLKAGYNRYGHREAITNYQLININKQTGKAIFEAELKTGRTHQIRIHFSDSGYPVINDPYYNYNFIKKLQVDKDNINQEEDIEMGLQASHLTFINPTTKLPVEINIDPPKSWRKYLE